MVKITNTLIPLGPVGFTWKQHKAAGYIGGTDYEIPADTNIPSPVAGKITLAGIMANGNYQVDISYAIGRKISLRELGSVIGSFPRTVKMGDIIGQADTSMWPHIDATILGIRRQFEPLVNTALTIADTGNPIIPIIQNNGEDMKLAIVKLQSGAYQAYLITSDGYAQLGPATLSAWRNNQTKDKGPLGIEFNWSGADFTRVKTSLRALPSASDAAEISAADS